MSDASQERLIQACAPLTHESGQNGSAWFSVDRLYRYVLLRGGSITDDTPAHLFLMLNPSTADGDHDDPTVRRCLHFAERLSHGQPHRLLIGNLYAYRATAPASMFAAPDPVGPQNDEILECLVAGAKTVILAWGAHAHSPARARRVMTILRMQSKPLYCLGTTRGGQPRHPLYLRKDTPFELVPEIQE